MAQVQGAIGRCQRRRVRSLCVARGVGEKNGRGKSARKRMMQRSCEPVDRWVATRRKDGAREKHGIVIVPGGLTLDFTYVLIFALMMVANGSMFVCVPRDMEVRARVIGGLDVGVRMAERIRRRQKEAGHQCNDKETAQHELGAEVV
ncbi:MAG: hypothetical protein U0791_06095 [Gemmataceae bacterium]